MEDGIMEDTRIIAARSRSGAGGSETTAMMSLLCQRIAAAFGFPLRDVVPAATLEHDLGLDRFDVFELLDALEAAFSVSIADEEAKSARTVSDLEHLISTSLTRTAA
jgi:acyl carrier protein